MRSDEKPVIPAPIPHTLTWRQRNRPAAQDLRRARHAVARDVAGRGRLSVLAHLLPQVHFDPFGPILTRFLGPFFGTFFMGYLFCNFLPTLMYCFRTSSLVFCVATLAGRGGHTPAWPPRLGPPAATFYRACLCTYPTTACPPSRWARLFALPGNASCVRKVSHIQAPQPALSAEQVSAPLSRFEKNPAQAPLESYLHLWHLWHL